MNLELITWLDWPERLNECVGAFRKRYGHFPNALFGNSRTFVWLDFVADKGSVVAMKGTSFDAKTKNVVLESFKTSKYKLSFYLDARLPDRVLRLAYYRALSGNCVGRKPVLLTRSRAGLVLAAYVR